MKRTILMLLIPFIALVFVSGVTAQQKAAPAPAATAAQPKMEKFTGAVDRVNEATKEVVVKKGKEEMTFSYSDKTKVMQGDKEMAFTDLKPGMNVTVQYKKEGNKMMADSFTVSTAKTAAKEKTTEKK